MTPGRSSEPPVAVVADFEVGAVPVADGRADCRTCDMRSACITWGWRSPGGLWFENAVILRPRPGCRGFVGRGDDIRAHFAAGSRTDRALDHRS